MSVPDPNLESRLQSIEQLVVREIASLRETSLRLSSVNDFRNLRLARTITDPDESEYPSSSADTFYIEFLDSYFTPEAQGSSSITSSSRESTAGGDGAFARNITGDFLAENTIVFALWQPPTNNVDRNAKGEWWIERVVSQAEKQLYLIRFQLTGTLAYGAHQTASATVLECSNGVAADIGSTVTVEDHTSTGFRGWSGYEGVAYAFKEDLDSGCNWTICFLEEKAEIAVWELTSGFSGGSPSTTTGTLVEYWQGRSPTGSETLRDPCDRYQHLSGGDCILTSYDDTADEYVILDGDLSPDLSDFCADILGFRSIVGHTRTNVDNFKTLTVNQDSWLSSYRNDVTADRGLISLEPNKYDNSVFQTLNGKPRWNQQLEVAKWLHTGMDLEGAGGGPTGEGDGLAWWKQTGPPVPPSVSADFWLGQGGDETQKWLIPHAEAWTLTSGTVLYVKATGKDNAPDYETECLQLGWTEPGVGGGAAAAGCLSQIELLDSQYEPVIFTFHAGVVVSAEYGPTASSSGSVLEVCDDPGDADCPDYRWPIIDPCTGEDDVVGTFSLAKLQRSNGVDPPNGPSTVNPTHNSTHDLGIATENEQYKLTISETVGTTDLKVTVTVTGDLWGTVSPSGEQTIPAGTSTVFTLTVLSGSNPAQVTGTVRVDHDGSGDDPFRVHVTADEIESE